MKAKSISGIQAIELLLALFLLVGVGSCKTGQEKDEGKTGKEEGEEIETDREKKKLAGKVVKVEQRKYEAKGSKEDPKKGERVGPAFENYDLRFNEKGMKVLETWYDSTGNMQRKVEIEYRDGTKPAKRILSKTAKKEQSRTIWKYNEEGHPVERILKGKGGGTKWKTVNEFDSAGRKIHTVRRSPEGDKIQETELERNEKGWVTEERRYNSAGSLERRTKYVRDEEGRVARETDYDDSGTEVGRFTFVYNEDGERTQVKKFGGSGDLQRWRDYEYNDHGHMTKEVHKNPKGGTKEEFTYRYEYDDKGNWTRRTTLRNGKPHRITERSYSYE